MIEHPKYKFIKFYETYQKENLDKTISDGDSFLMKKSKTGVISIVNNYTKILEEIKNYDISNFGVKFTYQLIIKPDKGFLELIDKLNKEIQNKISLDMEFKFSVNEGLINRIDFKEGIPDELIGYGLGYKLYKMVIIRYGYITTAIGLSTLAKNVWYNLMLDNDFYCFTSKKISGVITKGVENSKIKECLDKLKTLNYKIDFDEELKNKIVEIYGTMVFNK